MASAVPKEYTDARQLSSVSEARRIYNQSFDADDKRRTVRRLVTNQLEGGRPMSDQELDENGEGWRSNFNPRDAETAEARTLLPYWQARRGGIRSINAIVHTESKNGEKWGNMFEECFTLFEEDWGEDGEIEGRLIDKQYIRFGAGWMFWKDKKSPRGESIATGRILFPEDTPLQSGKWDMMIIRDMMGATELAKHLLTKKSRSTAKHLGWNLKTIKAILRNADRQVNSSTDPRDDESILDDITQNMIATEKLWPKIEVVYMYIKEDEGKIGKYLFAENPGGVDTNDADNEDETDDDFLFIKEDYEESFKRLVGPILYEVANGKIHALKGFGVRNFDWSNVLAKMKNQAVDGTVFSGMNFQSTGDLTDEGPPVENYGAINVFPPGLTQLTEQPNNQNTLRMIQFLDNNMAENNSIYREQGQLISDSATATQANLLAGISDKVELINVALYLSMYGGSIYTEQFRRLRMKGNNDPDAVKYKERCMERGMPEEVFHTVFTVILAGSDIAGGNPATRDVLWLDTFDRLRGEPGVDQRWLRENFVAQRHGPRAVTKAFLPAGSDTDKFGVRQAKGENHLMSQALSMEVIAQDDHMAHIPEHMKAIQAITELFIKDGQVKKQDQLILVGLGIPHVDKHFSFIENDETLDKVRAPMQKQWKKIKTAAENMIDVFALAKQQADIEQQNQ